MGGLWHCFNHITQVVFLFLFPVDSPVNGCKFVAGDAGTGAGQEKVPRSFPLGHVHGRLLRRL